MNHRSLIAAGVGLAAATAVVTPIATAGGHNAHAAAANVSVSGREYRFNLSSRGARAGRITFRFTNRGRIGHDFKIDGKKTPVINPGHTATFTVFLPSGTYRYICTVPGHAALGMKGTFTVR